MLRLAAQRILKTPVVQQPKAFNRYRVAVPALTNHLCLGSIFAWSIFNKPLTSLNGVIVPAAADWSLSNVSLTFSLVMGGFIWGGLIGSYYERIGPRASCLIGATSLGSGFGLASLAIHLQSLPLLYAAGTVWGFANAWAYVPPVATLLKWFPDRRGFAGGVCILGFGAGAAVAAPLFSRSLSFFSRPPTRIGSAEQLRDSIVTEGGRLFVNGAEVVVATVKDATAAGLSDAGVYLVGSGETGASATFAVLGALYAGVMGLSALMYRLPATPVAMVQAKQTPPQSQSQSSLSSSPLSRASSFHLHTHVEVNESTALKTNQFWLLYAGFGLSITGAYGVISAGKTMLTDCFSSSPYTSAAFISTFVALMSLGNLAGRVIWPTLSDRLGLSMHDSFGGRRRVFALMFGIGAPMYLGIVWAVGANAVDPTRLLPLIVFSGCVMTVMSSFGGAAATRPAFVSDTFGTRSVSVITARQLTVVMPTAYLGPRLVAYFRDSAVADAIRSLTEKVSDDAFFHAFGASKAELTSLIENKTVTLNRLLELLPADTIDPSPFVYNDAMYCMALLQFCALLTNAMMSPVPYKYYDEDVKEKLRIEHSFHEENKVQNK